MFESQATQLFVRYTWKGTFVHVVMIPRSYHTAAYPTNMVMLAVFLHSYGSIGVLEMDNCQEFSSQSHRLL